MTTSRATSSDRAYFERVAAQNDSLSAEAAPVSLAEMFDRIEQMRRTLGALANPGLTGSDDGDLASHLAFLERIKEIRGRGAKRTQDAG
jgi:hypothetical protein